MRLPSILLAAAAMVLASIGTANAQAAGQTYAVSLSTSPDALADCYRFGGDGPGGPFSSDLRDPTPAGTERWNSMGVGLSTYVFAGLSEAGVAWGGSGLVLLNFLLFSGQEMDENGVGVGYTVSGIADFLEDCDIVPDTPGGIAGLLDPD